MVVPCEEVIWKTLPAMRRELARIMVEELKISRREASEKLGITEAAISQYLKNKRGSKVIFTPQEIKLLKKAALKMANLSDSEMLSKEFCAVCSAVRREGLF
ncbi:MAG: helix-turn-helix domain-containing protein [Candidatus Woesearchaeota archaeon]